ncbi:MAG: prepilin-type N-terminal cleavage/methylation domain-containing protein [Deltaproteobacteria bacterium]|nr:prepilin-type N-terminal cleavage/methylation domain-containing protein [Deltaproteobacteria bacterium]
MSRPAPRGGFSLIEVMIAIAILAMAMATVFGSNVGAARNVARARRLTQATLMARCRLVEIDAWLLKNQLPDEDKTLEDPPESGPEPCCTDGVTCDAEVEKIELPAPPEVETAAGDALLGRAAGSAQGSSFGAPGLPVGGDGGVSNPFGALAGAMGMMSSGPGGSSGGSPGGSGSLSGAGAPNPREMASALMTTVYPSIKPMMEGAIRRLTVTVRWREGSAERSFRVVEYVTNPGQTLSLQDAARSPLAPNVQTTPTGQGVLPGGGTGLGGGGGGVNLPRILP